MISSNSPLISLSPEPNGSFLVNSATSLHLKELGYPENSIKSMNRCGQMTGFHVLKTCGCGNEVIPLKHHCNLRTCPECAKIRKRKILRKYMPLMKNLATDRTYFIYFLTIAPPNYTDLKEGKKNLQQSFAKFLRNKYVKDRIKAGLYVIETKGGEGNWNIHLHALVYGRYMDNKMRGKCFDCGQNLLKYDKATKEFYCGNSKCNSKNVKIIEDSKITRLFQQCSKNKARVHIQRQNSSLYSLNYMAKYISANKDEFNSDKDVALYMVATKDQRLISSFGLFYKVKIPKSIPKCSKCGEIIYYTFDIGLNIYFEKYLDTENYLKEHPNAIKENWEDV